MTDPGDRNLRPGAARLARYAGLAGALLLTVAGWLGGALPHAAGSTTPLGIWRSEHGPWVLGCWLVGTALLVGASVVAAAGARRPG
ncbi:hypothetical protein JNW88_30280, partial [Micromonospora sp. ATA32]|nr:hypothetical protein [Micromonospora sp. ATA32]